MKSENVFFAVLIGGVIVYRLLRKPVYRATWSLFAGPKFYASLTETIKRNDPAEIKHLHESYDSWPPDTQSQFRSTVRKIGLKLPW